MVLNSVVFNKRSRPLKKTYAGWIRILIKSEYGCKMKNWNCCDKLSFQVPVIYNHQNLFNLNISKLKMVVLAPTKETFSSFNLIVSEESLFLQCLLLPWGLLTSDAPQCKPSAQFPVTEKQRGLSFYISCFSLQHAKPWVTRLTLSACSSV